jgi:hypothetical protein
VMVFVSYVRKENDESRLKEIATIVSELGRPYIDDLEDHRDDADRYETVINAARTAKIFVSVATPNYPNTTWTCWEFSVAATRGIPRFALLPSGDLVGSMSPLWPWKRSDEAAYLRLTNVESAPLPPRPRGQPQA